MKVAFRDKPEAVQERVRSRIQVGINDVRRAVGWDWATANEHCLDVFGAIVQDMTAPQLYRFYKDLWELRKFQQWKEKR